MKRFFLIALLLSFALPCWGQQVCGQWVKTEKTEKGIDSLRLDGSIRHCTYWTFIHPDDMPPPDSVWISKECFDIDSIIISWFNYKTTGLVSDVANGFWVYWNPRIEASGDTFVVFMADSLWMTGDKPKTKGGSWCGWKSWGLWFWVQ